MIKENIKQEGPLVSVIVPAYNHGQYIGDCLKSIINQTYINIELIVINDGSSDNTHNVILSLSDECRKRFKRFVYVNKEKNEGIAKTLNQGIELSKGKYISFLASDDIIMPYKFEVLVSEFEKLGNDYAVVCGDATFIDSKGNRVYLDEQGSAFYKRAEEYYDSFLEYYTRYRTDFDYKKDFGLYETFLLGNYIPAMATILHSEALKDVGLFDEGNFIEDYDMWLKLSRRYKFKYVQKVVACYRIHESNSVKVLRKELVLSTTKLLIREKPYSYRNGLKKKWETGYSGSLIGLLKTKQYRSFLKYFWKVNIVEFFILNTTRFLKRFLRNLQNGKGKRSLWRY